MPSSKAQLALFVSCRLTTASPSRPKAISAEIPRAKERRKYGLKKARKAPQFSKR